MRPAPLAGLAFLPLLVACTQFPTLDRKVDPAVMQSPYPALAPFEAVGIAAPPPTPEEDPAAQLIAEGDALKAQSQALQSKAPE